MKTIITQDMIDKIINAHEQNKGTPNYTDYLMELSYKVDNRWVFCGYGIPYRINTEYYLKKIKNKLYIYVLTKDKYLERFEVNRFVSELLNLEVA